MLGRTILQVVVVIEYRWVRDRLILVKTISPSRQAIVVLFGMLGEILIGEDGGRPKVGRNRRGAGADGAVGGHPMVSLRFPVDRGGLGYVVLGEIKSRAAENAQHAATDPRVVVFVG